MGTCASRATSTSSASSPSTVELTLLVAYTPTLSLVEGTAELAIKIKVLFFKKTVRFEVHQRSPAATAIPRSPS